MNYEELVKALRDIEKTMFALGTSPINMGNVSISLAYDKRWGQTAEAAAAAIEELQAQLPKRGEMYFLEYDNPETGEYEQTYFQCSVCGKYFYALDECEVKHFNYCPNCGAKMEVQE